MSGGKGGSQTQSVQIPAWVEDAAKRNLARAEAMSRVGYMPYYGTDVMGFGPTGDLARQANIDAAIAYGIVPEGTTAAPMGDLSSGTLYDQAVAEYQRRNPASAAYYDQFFMNPRTGDFPVYDAAQMTPGFVAPIPQNVIASNSGGDGGGDTFLSSSDPYYGSQFGRDVGFGLANMPFSPVMNLIGEGIISNEIDAISRSFENLPTTTGGDSGGDSGGGSSMGAGQSPTGDDTGYGTPF